MDVIGDVLFSEATGGEERGGTNEGAEVGGGRGEGWNVVVSCRRFGISCGTPLDDFVGNESYKW